MNPLLELLDHPLVGAVGWTLLHFVWQGALIGLAAFVLRRVVRPADASVRYVIGLGALGAMLAAAGGTLAFMTTPADAMRMASRAESQPTHSSAYVTGHIISEAPANPSAARRLLSQTPRLPSVPPAPVAPFWLVAATLAWGVGVLILSLRLLGGWVLTRTLARRAIAAVSPAIECAARQIARRLELPRAVAVLESSAVAVPTLVGWVRPVVLLPASALSGLSPVQLEAILAHELAHVRRHDYLANLLQSVVETLLFYHPVVWWVSADVRAEREHCCDDLAIAVCGDRLLYVSALAELTSLERRSLALAATDGLLVGRVRRILGRPVERRREPPPSWGILALLALLAGAGSFEMSNAASAREQAARDAFEPTVASTSARIDSGELAGVEAVASVPSGPSTPARVQAPVPPVAPPAPLSGPPVAPAAPVATPAPVAPVAPTAPTAPTAVDAPDAPDAPSLQTPPAPPSPPSPPPPSPPAPPSPPPAAEMQTSRGEGNFTWSNNGDRITVKWTGPFRLSDDERDIAWIEEGARVTISNGWVFTDRIELRGLDGGRVERNFYKSGFRKDYESDGRLFLANALARMIRSGMFATERVARLLAQGGPDAVLVEVDRLQTDSNYVKRAYYSALLKQADLDNAQLARLLQRVGDGMTSDYDRSTLLVQIIREGKLTEEQQISVARVVRRLGSDFEQRKVLSALLTTTPLSAPVAMAVVEAAESIGSAYDRGTVLLDLAGKGAVTPETSARFMAAVSSMGSAYEQRKVLAALATAQPLPEPVVLDGVKAAGEIGSAYDKRQALSAYVARSASSPKVAAAAVASAATIGSSHDKAEVLLDLVQKGGFTDETAAAFFAAAATIGSSYDLARVLRAVAAIPRLHEPVLAGLIRASGSVSSGYERATLLLEILKNQTLLPSERALFLDVAQTISSQHDQNRVLAELVRSERR